MKSFGSSRGLNYSHLREELIYKLCVVFSLLFLLCVYLFAAKNPVFKTHENLKRNTNKKESCLQQINKHTQEKEKREDNTKFYTSSSNKRE
jgi:hypothetical protein